MRFLALACVVFVCAGVGWPRIDTTTRSPTRGFTVSFPRLPRCLELVCAAIFAQVAI